MYNMDQFNLLDLNNDVLDIIGDYVKADNDEKEFQKYLRGEVINNSIKLLKIIKNASFTKKDMRDLIINYYYVNNIRDIVTIDLFTCSLGVENEKIKNIIKDYFVINAFNIDANYFTRGN